MFFKNICFKSIEKVKCFKLYRARVINVGQCRKNVTHSIVMRYTDERFVA